MEGMELGRFGDLRLEKGGRSFWRGWSRQKASVFDGWEASGAAKYGGVAFYPTRK